MIQETAEAHLGYKVKKAVITVPAFFDTRQRQVNSHNISITSIENVKVLEIQPSLLVCWNNLTPLHYSDTQKNSS